jgi:hypothetical protein
MYPHERPKDEITSWPGMAHLAGTGPEGATCAGCTHFARCNIWIGRCKQYVTITGKNGATFPLITASCKFFAPRGGVQ